MGGGPVAAVTGNHESDVSADQMRAAGMTVLDGSTAEVAGVGVLGDGDPTRTELFGGTKLRGDESEADLGTRLYEQAREDHPELVLVHEAYAAEAFVGTTGMTDFLEARGSATTPYDDGVRDLPAGALFYGHWHRSIEPRVVWNDDGTWTLVMELDTSGGAIDTPTIGHFSTPWSRPQQEASFPVVFLDPDQGLVTGYQIYSFADRRHRHRPAPCGRRSPPRHRGRGSDPTTTPIAGRRSPGSARAPSREVMTAGPPRPAGRPVSRRERPAGRTGHSRLDGLADRLVVDPRLHLVRGHPGAGTPGDGLPHARRRPAGDSRQGDRSRRRPHRRAPTRRSRWPEPCSARGRASPRPWSSRSPAPTSWSSSASSWPCCWAGSSPSPSSSAVRS